MRRSVAGQRASRCRVGEPLDHARGTSMPFPCVGDTRTACVLENGATHSPIADVRGVWGDDGFLDATRDEATPSMQWVQRQSAAGAMRQHVTWRTCIRRACHQGRRR